MGISEYGSDSKNFLEDEKMLRNKMCDPCTSHQNQRIRQTNYLFPNNTHRRRSGHGRACPLCPT